MRPLPFRQVHLDFHTSEHIASVGQNFDPDRFASVFAQAHVDSVTCFARCHHGYLYYQSKRNPELIHPGLVRKNLLNEQIETLHRIGIRAPIYTTVQWDGRVTREHPEWCCVSPEGGWVGQSPSAPGFYASLCVNSGYRSFLFGHVDELLDRFDVDGLFFDIVRPVECLCSSCRHGMESSGLDPFLKEDRMRFADKTIQSFRHEMSDFVRKRNPDCTIFYNASHVGPDLRSSMNSFTHLEIESLPSGGWGYTHFPYVARYAQCLGKETIGMTGRFHTYWGDFHSYKNIEALEFECFQMLAHGGGCSIGDQLSPSGVLDQVAYDTIAPVYRRVEALEPWVRNTRAVREIAVLNTEPWSDGSQPAEMIGAVRMLQEAGFLFDIVDLESDVSEYRLLILPDRVPAEELCIGFVRRALVSGCAVLGSFDAHMSELCVIADPVLLQDSSGNDPHGVVYERNDFSDYIIPQGRIGAGLPETPHVMYIRGREVKLTESVLADPSCEITCCTPSYFDRLPQHYCSHQQSPPLSDALGRPGVVLTDRTCYFAHPVFQIYHERAARWVRNMVTNAVISLIGTPVLRHNGPTGLIVTAREIESNRGVVLHVLYYLPERRARNMDVIEDVIDLNDLRIDVKLPTGEIVVAATTVPNGQLLDCAVHQSSRTTTISLPVLHGYEVIECQCE